MRREKTVERRKGRKAKEKKRKGRTAGCLEREVVVVSSKEGHAGSPLVSQRHNSLCFDRSSLRRDSQTRNLSRRPLVEGFCVAAGILTTKTTEIVESLTNAGIKHVSFEPSSVDGTRQV